MKLKEMRESAPSSGDLVAAYRAAREELTRRRAKVIDRGAEKMEKRMRELERGARSASWRARRDLAERLHPERRRRNGGLTMLLIGLGLGAGIGYALADKRNRERFAEYARMLADRAKPVVESASARLGGSQPMRAAEESALLAEAEAVLAAGGAGGGLKVSVEGRTVYLRGQAPAELSQEVADKLRNLSGAAAVVNLSMAAPSAGAATERVADQAPTTTSGR